jgi:hypothetical protein
MTVWLCDCMTVWLYDCMTVWLYGCMTVWLCGCVTVWLYDCMTVWLYDCATVWLYSCVAWTVGCVNVWRVVVGVLRSNCIKCLGYWALKFFQNTSGTHDLTTVNVFRLLSAGINCYAKARVALMTWLQLMCLGYLALELLVMPKHR